MLANPLKQLSITTTNNVKYIMLFVLLGYMLYNFILIGK